MALIAVPFIADQPGLAGLDASLDSEVSIGDLPWDLHVAAEDEEELLFGSPRQPFCVLLDTVSTQPNNIHKRLIPPLVTLQLNGSGSTPTREAWVFNPARSDVTQTVRLPIRSFDAGEEFALRAGVDEDALTYAHTTVSRALRHHPELEVTLEHLLLAVARSDLSRGLLDATICLESLIRVRHEVSFRFSHEVGRLVSDGPRTLAEAQGLLKNLYDYRSSHVHGSSGKKYARQQKELWDVWPELERLMKQAVTYALEFHAGTTEKQAWKRHLEGLLIGIEAPLAPEWGPPR